MERLFKMPVQHRAVGANAQIVGRAVDVKVVIPISFVFANLIADFRMKNLRSATRHTAKSNIF